MSKTTVRCPNHNVPLIDINWQSGYARCPISYAVFKFDAEADKKITKHRINAMGQIEAVVDWNVKNMEGGEK